MDSKKRCSCFEQYPVYIIILSNFVSLSIYFIGAYLLYQLSIILVGVYALYILALQIRLMKRSCVNCYYYGKLCAFGTGKLSSLFFKKEDTNKFSQKQIGWKDLFSDFLVVLIPLFAGIAILIMQFSYKILALVILLLLMASIGNGFIRSSLACKYCKQREIGCPAEKLFQRKKRSKKE